VLPPGDPWLNEADVFTPMAYTPDVDNSNGFELSVIGRLRPGVWFDAARSDLKRTCLQLASLFPRQDAGMGIAIEPAARWGADSKLQRALWVLAGSVACLLLITCVNLANLMLAKAAARSRELMVRAALGASRARITRLVVTEALVVSFLGAGLGLALSFFALDLIQSVNVTGIPHLAEAAVNGWVLAVAFLTTIAVGVLSGLFPAIQAPHRNVAAALREGDRNQTGSRAQNRLRAALVAAEVALSFVLLIGAGLLFRSFAKLTHVDRGFQSENRLVFSVNLPGLSNEDRLEGLLRQFLPRVKALPGVIAAAAVNTKPIVGPDPGMGIVAAKPSDPTHANVPWASWRFITSGYFRAIGIPLLEGREFSEQDRKITIRPVVISQKLAQTLWPGENPIGKQVNLWKGQGEKLGEVVGVVGNVRDHGLDSDPTPIVYLPYYGQFSSPIQFIVHTAVPPGSVVPGLRQALTQIDASLPISDVRSLDDVVNSTLGPKRLNMSLLGVFAGLALLLAMAGIYGVLSYSVAKRTAEIGLRVALGAERKRIFGLIIGQGMRPIIVGIAVGLAISAALSRFLLDLLFEVEPTDFATYFTVAILVTVTALISCYFPARRALYVDPASALREE
jgi:putative ABC transport system permease protein